MQAQDSLSAIPRTQLGQSVAELPVRDAERARDHYRDKRGFDLGCVYPEEALGITQLTVEDPDGNVFHLHGD